MNQISPLLLNILAIVGLFSSSYAIVALVKNLVHYSRFKSFPKSLNEEKLVLIKNENQRLSEKISQLEQENQEMTLMVLQKLK